MYEIWLKFGKVVTEIFSNVFTDSYEGFPYLIGNYINRQKYLLKNYQNIFPQHYSIHFSQTFLLLTNKLSLSMLTQKNYVTRSLSLYYSWFNDVTFCTLMLHLLTDVKP